MKYINYVIIIFEIMVVSIAFSLLLSLINQNDNLNEILEDKFKMMIAADELRHSSDNLMHYARTYVVTSDKKYKQLYLETIKSVSLTDIMSTLPFSTDEISKLIESQNNSNKLVGLEIEAFKAMDLNEKNQKLAIELLYSIEYEEYKHNITEPIKEFTIMSNKRMSEEFEFLRNEINVLYIFMLLIAFVFALGNYFVFKYIQKRLTSEIKSKTYALKEINEHLEIRVDEELEKTTQKHEQMLYQSRLAQLGEMISMIAHQWRQPLGAISSSTIDLKMKMELEVFDLKSENGRVESQEYITKTLNSISSFVESLTTTIDDFRDFYKVNKVPKLAKIDEPIQKALSIIESSLKTNNIQVIQDYQSKKEVELFDSEIIQVVLNIFKNSEDNFKLVKVDKAKISVTTLDTSSGAILKICDNGGGIKPDVIDQIFDPYFSTKYAKNGTGLGLYMSRLIVHDHHNGKISAENTDDGVCFIVELNNRKYQ